MCHDFVIQWLPFCLRHSVNYFAKVIALCNEVVIQLSFVWSPRCSPLFGGKLGGIKVSQAQMNRTALRLCVVQALAGYAEEHLAKLRHLSEFEIRRLVLWLDESGLALYFFRCIGECNAVDSLPRLLVSELASRQQQNRGRVQLMLNELGRVNEALSGSGARYAFLKGFSLSPDFCPDCDCRHHNDIDVLIHRECIETAKGALGNLGYRLVHTFPSGEHKLVLPLPRVGASIFDIYRPADVGILELHLSMCESPDDIPLSLPDPFDSLTTQTVRGITFPSLNTQDKFLLQLLHTFRHLTLMWMRVSWLYEISVFLRQQREPGWWVSFCERAGPTSNIRHACGLMVGLTQKLFGSVLPDPLQEWCINDLPSSFQTWIDCVSTRWALSSASENRSPMLIQRQFLSSDLQWGHYLRRQLLPLERVVPSIQPHPLDVFRVGGLQTGPPWRAFPRLTLLHLKRMIRLVRDASIMARRALEIRTND